MMKRVVIMACLLAVGLTLHAQTKAEQIKHIRQVYAEAKQKVAKMGQDGKAAHTVHIRQIEMGEPGGEYTPESGRKNARLFDLMLNTERPYPELASAHRPSSTPKAKLLKDIRAAYAKAKQRIAQNDKDGGLKNDIEITIHDQKSEDFPPVTTRLKCYYEQIPQPSPHQHYYFISEKTVSMYGETYEEYLLDPKPDSQNVVFIYNQGYAEGEEMEMRYYYDENGHCFESKVSDIVESEPVPSRNKAGYIFSIFDELMQ